MASNTIPIALFYLAVLTLAEIWTVLMDPRVGLALYLLILFVLLLHAALKWQKPIHRFLLGLTFVPIIRVVSLALPLSDFPLLSWYLIVAIPLFAVTFVSMVQMGLGVRARALRGQGLLPQLAFAITGLIFGYIEYRILSPEPLVMIYSWDHLLVATLILLIGIGLLEEVIFRGIMQRTSTELLGRTMGIVYVALIFAMLYIGYKSILAVMIALAIGLLFGWFVARTGSLLGVTLSHGLANVVMFLVIPFWLVTSGQAEPPKLETILTQGILGNSPITLPAANSVNLMTPEAEAFAGTLIQERPPTPQIFWPSPTPDMATEKTLAAPTKSREMPTEKLEPTSTPSPEIITKSSPEATAVTLATLPTITVDVTTKVEILPIPANPVIGCGIVPAGWKPYIVQRGDTLLSLAQSRGTTVQEVTKVNCLTGSRIYYDRQLLLPPVANSTISTSLGNPPIVPSISVPTQTGCSSRAGWESYIVIRGDTLYEIAKSRGTTVQEVMQANCLTGSRIDPGMVLLLPSASLTSLSLPANLTSTPPSPATDTPRPARWFITSPPAWSILSGTIPIIGTADFDPAEVQFYKVELGGSGSQWVTLGSISSKPVINGSLETLPTAGMLPGDYQLRLVLVSWEGNYVGEPYTVPVKIE